MTLALYSRGNAAHRSELAAERARSSRDSLERVLAELPSIEEPGLRARMLIYAEVYQAHLDHDERVAALYRKAAEVA